MTDIKTPARPKCKVENTLKLKNFLCLVKNKRNRQYSFVLKKRAMADFGLSPNNILNINVVSKKKISKKK